MTYSEFLFDHCLDRGFSATSDGIAVFDIDASWLARNISEDCLEEWDALSDADQQDLAERVRETICDSFEQAEEDKLQMNWEHSLLRA